MVSRQLAGVSMSYSPLGVLRGGSIMCPILRLCAYQQTKNLRHASMCKNTRGPGRRLAGVCSLAVSAMLAEGAGLLGRKVQRLCCFQATLCLRWCRLSASLCALCLRPGDDLGGDRCWTPRVALWGPAPLLCCDYRLAQSVPYRDIYKAVGQGKAARPKGPDVPPPPRRDAYGPIFAMILRRGTRRLQRCSLPRSSSESQVNNNILLKNDSEYRLKNDSEYRGE